MAYNGWFPCFSPSGAHVLTGTGDLWINGTQRVGAGYQSRWGGNSLWTSDTRLLFLGNVSGNAYGLWTVNVGGLPQNLNIPYGFSEFAVAQGGRWAGWTITAGQSVFRTSWGTTVAGARGPAITRAHIAYITEWAGTQTNQKLYLDSAVVDTAPIINVMMTETALCWSRLNGALGYEPYGLRLDIADTIHTLQASSVMEFCAIPIDTPLGKPWVLSYENTRLILRPWRETNGYVINTGENNNLYPAGVYHQATGTFRIGWSNASGVYSEAYIDPNDTRVALGGTSAGETPSEALPGSPGAASASYAMYPPLRHPMSDPQTGLVTEPWAAWFEAQSAAGTATDFSAMPANTLVGRGSTGSGFASTLTLGTGLRMRNTTLSVDLSALVSDIIRYGTRANQPDADAVATGTLYGVTDESVVERSNGTTWDPFGTW